MVKFRITYALAFLFISLFLEGQDLKENYSQSDSAYYCSFFPMHVGDKWVYKTDYGESNASFYFYEIVMDTVDSLNRRWYGWKYGESNRLSYYTITNSFEVINKEGSLSGPDSILTYLMYKLDAKQGDKWLVTGDLNDGGTVALVDTIYNPETNDAIMKVDWWYCFNNELILWESSVFLKQGIGVNEIWWEAGPLSYLVGAIIGGVIYGSPNEISQEKLSIISNFHLYQNYPNPFNLYTTIPFYLDHIGTVELNIYDLLGRLIFTKKSSYQIGGYHQFKWNCLNNKAEPVSSGIYIYELSTSENKKRMKMTVNK